MYWAHSFWASKQHGTGPGKGLCWLLSHGGWQLLEYIWKERSYSKNGNKKMMQGLGSLLNNLPSEEVRRVTLVPSIGSSPSDLKISPQALPFRFCLSTSAHWGPSFHRLGESCSNLTQTAVPPKVDTGEHVIIQPSEMCEWSAALTAQATFVPLLPLCWVATALDLASSSCLCFST